MKKSTSIPEFRKSKLCLMLAGGMLIAGPAMARDNGYMNNTIQDCVHGGTGTSVNMDCTRSRASRATNDTNAYNTDTGELNGAHLRHTNSAAVDSRDGMTAISEQQ